jgi:hypothetical protein
MTYSSDEIKILLNQFKTDLNNVSLMKAISNNLSTLEEIKELNAIKWVNVIKILNLDINPTSFKQAVYRARKKRDRNPPNKLTTNPLTIEILDKQEEVKPIDKVDENDDYQYPYKEWFRTTGVSENSKLIILRAEKAGLKPSDFEGFRQKNEKGLSLILPMLSGWVKQHKKNLLDERCGLKIVTKESFLEARKPRK